MLSRMFNACRIPAKPADYAVKLREDAKEGAHFIAIRQNRYYKVPLFDSQGRKPSLQSLQE
jgi:carnitine O-acetyltransferase